MNNNTPPKFALRFLEWFCPPALYEGIEGDLLEAYEDDIKDNGRRKANLRLGLNVLKFFRPGIILRNKFTIRLFNTMMLRNYTTVAFRSLWRSRAHSLINVTGLSLGIACCILIVLFVKDEWTFDTFHVKADRIYRGYVKEDYGENQQFFNTVTPFALGPALKDNFPEVETQVRIHPISNLVKVGEIQFSETVIIAGQDFYNVFDFPAVSGSTDKALREVTGIVITQRTAQKYFGDADPVNKVISIQLGEKVEDFSVKAVVENPPINSSIQFDLMISDLNYPKLYGERLLTSAWFSVTPETYVLLKQGTDVNMLQTKFAPVFRSILGEETFNESKYFVGLQPLTDIHLNTDFPVGMAPVSNPRYAYILSVAALLILFVACINFVTLSVGRSIRRAKEVGIRKVVGAVRKQLVTQFIGEAVIITMISLAVGVLLAVVSLPLFNQLSGKNLTLEINEFTVFTGFSLIVIIGLLAGSYPAFVLSNFRPVAILKGSLTGINNRQSLRRVLVGAQLVLSVFLISSTFIMQGQLKYLQNKNLGFNKEQLAVLQLNIPRVGRLTERIKVGFGKVEQFKHELAGLPDIAGVCGASHDFARGSWTNIGYTDDNGTYRTFFTNVVEPDYFSVMKMEFAAGRNFDVNNPADARRGIIINEAFAKELGWKEALGKRIPGKNFDDHEVIGVVKDFNYSSLHAPVEPLVLVLDPVILANGTENINSDNSPIPKVLIRLKPGNMSATIDLVKNAWDKITGGEEFAFTFVDQALAAQYQGEQNLGKILRVATLLAIVIGSLGLYGLASLSMQNKTKEISIRKVMGATRSSLLVLLSKEYVLLVGISLLLSVPITWYLMMQWLESFEYRISIGWEHFAFAGAISLIVALVTISYQILKTTSAQPADTLKYE